MRCRSYETIKSLLEKDIARHEDEASTLALSYLGHMKRGMERTGLVARFAELERLESRIAAERRLVSLVERARAEDEELERARQAQHEAEQPQREAAEREKYLADLRTRLLLATRSVDQQLDLYQGPYSHRTFSEFDDRHTAVIREAAEHGDWLMKRQAQNILAELPARIRARQQRDTRNQNQEAS